ncbi:hypothetical protein V6N13_139998 [Hibiscus sabdariffa]|uniref:Uncharacterized protein n=1 Tax=Hibiscus sabdariffa TaxID=183260 RepID=A0ABR2QBQ9_9ROSI
MPVAFQLTITAHDEYNPMQYNAGSMPRGLHYWVPPPLLWIKVNTDAAWREVYDYSGCDGVVRDYGVFM